MACETSAVFGKERTLKKVYEELALVLALEPKPACLQPHHVTAGPVAVAVNQAVGIRADD